MQVNLCLNELLKPGSHLPATVSVIVSAIVSTVLSAIVSTVLSAIVSTMLPAIVSTVLSAIVSTVLSAIVSTMLPAIVSIVLSAIVSTVLSASCTMPAMVLQEFGQAELCRQCRQRNDSPNVLCNVFFKNPLQLCGTTIYRRQVRTRRYRFACTVSVNDYFADLL